MIHPFDTEQELLRRLAEGDRAAAEQLYRQNHKPVSNWIQNHGGSQADADDVFQESMVVLFEKAQFEEFRLSCKIGTYLFAVSKHLWYKRIQKLQKQPILLPDNAGNDGGADWKYDDDIKSHKEREEHYSQLNAALEQLGEPCRSLILAFYNQDKSMQEISEQFGYTNAENAKNQKYKCLNRLRKIFYGEQAKWQ
jgi:RNA polymerase sigma factor (sigma-70 family)